MGSLTKANDLERRREALRSAKAPSVTRQMTVRSLVDHWDAMTTEERKRLVGFIFEEVRAGVDGIKRFLPWEDWRRYMRTVLGCLPERKTGLGDPERTLNLVRHSDRVLVVRTAASSANSPEFRRRRL
jgi:hypothetical protein